MSPLLAIGVGPVEIGVLLLVVLLLFGNRLPSLARSLGRSVVDFKKGLSGVDEESETGTLPPKS
jgi:sec-independent protein translocase protein TatA